MTFAEQLEKKGEKRGRQEGRQKGERQKALAISKNMLALGLDVKIIQKATELSEQEIKSLV